MANKPDKFGIKFWIAVDLESKYILNAIPYLGKVETRPDTKRLSESVIIKLVAYLGKVEIKPDTQRLSESVVIKLVEP